MVDVEVELFPGPLPADPPVFVTVTVTVSVDGVLVKVDGVGCPFRDGELKIF